MMRYTYVETKKGWNMSMSEIYLKISGSDRLVIFLLLELERDSTSNLNKY
jgi:hypothetical protein